jgi:hypothetical protein
MSKYSQQRTLYTNNEVVACLFSFEQYIKDHYALFVKAPGGGVVRVMPEPGRLVEAWQKEDLEGGTG